VPRLTAALADRYRIERELGQGGMATVYLAEDLKHHRKVAIKVLREDLAASMGSARFLREIEIAAQLQHPNILPLLDSGDADGFLYYVMPYVTGQSLRERLAREGELPVHEAVRLITEVVDALAHAHEHGVVHRDIKPDNVMMSGRHALVADFGVAKAVSEATGRSTVTTLGVAVGTPAYMSPEQATADPHIDHRSDIYAVGAMAYELLTGRPPFVGATPQQVLAAHVTEAPDPVGKRRPGISAPLEAVIMRCLAKRPADRWQTAGELHAALEPFATPSSGITPVQTQPVRAVRPQRRLPELGIAVVVIVLVVIAAWRLTSGHGGSKGSARAIAVLPFDNATRDTAFDYLADGIANDVRSGLMKLPGLSVKARTSSEAAKGKPVHDAGALLNVGVVLQGEFRHAADKTTVTVELVNVSDESALWTGSFVLPADGNFAAAQDSITAAVSKALHLQATAGAATALVQRGTNNAEAYDLYLKGQHFFAERGGANLRRAIDYYQMAIARDSNFARAYAGLSMLITILPSYVQFTSDSTTALMSEASRLAHRALAIDPTLVEGHLALANVLQTETDLVSAEPEFLAALAGDPRNVTAHQWHGNNLTLLGRVDEGIREGRAAVDLDPLSAVAGNDLAYNLMSAGQFDEAIRVGHRALELDSTLIYSGEYTAVAFAFAGQRDSAAKVFEHFFRADSMGPYVRAYHVWEFALMGRWADAQRELATIEGSVAGGSRDMDLAVANLALGNKGAALDAIERAARAHSFYASTEAFACDPTFALLRSEPRLIAVVKQMGQGVCNRTDKWPIPARTKP
jgi:TolB-like protein/tRNA A-37 threonylcarbamoyl transferase component Bud32